MLYPELSCGCLISIISSQFKLHKSALIQFLKLYNHKSYVEVMQCKSVVGRMICCKFSLCTTGNGHKKRKENSLQLTPCSWFCSKFAKKVFLVQFCFNSARIKDENMKFGSMRQDTQKEKVFARFSSSKPIRQKRKSN